MNYISDKNLVKIVIFPYFLGTLALNISDDDWLMLKNSAEKQAKKIYEIFFRE